MPNIITVVRILLTPLFVICLIRDLFPLALLVFAAAGISDGLDGFLARYFDQRTELGAYLDPIADKMLLMAAFISLAVMEIVPPWLGVLVISRDVLIMLAIAVFSLLSIEVKIKPSIISKFTTACQIATVSVALLATRVSGLGLLNLALVWITATLTVLSGIHYVIIGLRILHIEESSGPR